MNWLGRVVAIASTALLGGVLAVVPWSSDRAQAETVPGVGTAEIQAMADSLGRGMPAAQQVGLNRFIAAMQKGVTPIHGRDVPLEDVYQGKHGSTAQLYSHCRSWAAVFNSWVTDTGVPCAGIVTDDGKFVKGTKQVQAMWTGFQRGQKSAKGTNGTSSRVAFTRESILRGTDASTPATVKQQRVVMARQTGSTAVLEAMADDLADQTGMSKAAAQTAVRSSNWGLGGKLKSAMKWGWKSTLGLANAAGFAMMGEEIGGFIGGGLADLFLGNTDGVVCAGADEVGGLGGELIKHFGRADCTDFENALAAANQNTDITSAYKLPMTVCSSQEPDSCITVEKITEGTNERGYEFTKVEASVSGGSTDGSTQEFWVFTQSLADLLDQYPGFKRNNGQLGLGIDANGLYQNLDNTSRFTVLPGIFYTSPSSTTAESRTIAEQKGVTPGLPAGTPRLDTSDVKIVWAGWRTYNGAYYRYYTPDGTQVNSLDWNAIFDHGGQVVTIPAADSNPERQWQTCMTYTDGTEACSMSDPWHESDDQITMPAAAPDEHLDKTPAGVTVYEVTDGQRAPTPAYAAQPDPGIAQDDARFPGCRDGSCTLDLRKTDTQVSCFDSGTDCSAWAEDPDRSTKYTCTYGSDEAGWQTLDLSECTVYQSSFKRESAISGDTLVDPDTGKSLGQTDEPAASTNPDKASCWGSGWSWNPLDWVLTPIKCALQWAFLPSERQLASLEDGLDVSATRVQAVGRIRDAVAVMSEPWPDSQGCEGIVVPFSKASGIIAGAQDVRVAQSCDGSLKWFRQTVYAMFLAFMTIVIVRNTIRIAGSQLGFDELPTDKGKDDDS